jgi:uncharacterized repeat protein (TIGR01451 family)
VTWTRGTPPPFTGCGGYASVAYGNGLFMALACQQIWTSPDGVDWTLRKDVDWYPWGTPQDCGWLWDVVYGNGRFFTHGWSHNICVSADDGTTWVPQEQPTGHLFIGVAHAPGTNRAFALGDAAITYAEFPPVVSINDVSADEGGAATFTVSLSAPSFDTVTVDVTTFADTATEGTDYEPTADTLTFDPGETVRTVVVQTYLDAASEGAESFFVELSSPTSAAVRWSRGTGTILDAPLTDLSITKDDGLTEIPAGDPVSYTITVTNNGPTAVSSVVVTDPVPPEILTPVFTPSEGSYDSETGVWTGLDLAATESVTLTLAGTLSSGATGSLVNTATVSLPGGAPDENPANDSDSDTDTITGGPDMIFADDFESGDTSAWSSVIGGAAPIGGRE